MSKVKNDMLERIRNKANKRKEMREKSATNKDAVNYAMRFLKEAEEMTAKLGEAAMMFVGLSANSLEKQLMTIDPGVKIDVNFDNKTVVSVTIHWSDKYAQDNKLDKHCTIDMTAFLFSDI
jgi:hypothetical protein